MPGAQGMGVNWTPGAPLVLVSNERGTLVLGGNTPQGRLIEMSRLACRRLASVSSTAGLRGGTTVAIVAWVAWREAHRTAVAALVAVAAVAGCSTVPPPIVAPASRATNTAALTWSIDYGYAHAHIQRPDGSIQTISGNGDSTWGNPDPEATDLTLPIPAAGSLHQVTGNQLVDFTQTVGIAVALTFHPN
jgi:hypothetical protein